MDSKEGLDALFRHATEGIIVTNKAGILTQVNPAAYRMFGYNEGELENQPLQVLIPERYHTSHAKHQQNYTNNPHARSMGEGVDLFARKKNGSEFPVEISLSPYKANEEQYVIGFIIDITLRKNAERALKNYSQELEKQVEKRTMIMKEAIAELEQTRDELNKALGKEKELNELKTRFVSMASHEFRTPLATVLSSLSLVSKKLQISVKDAGIGISKEDQKHLYQRFFRGSNATNIPGTGLGLNIVARYVELLKGIIECESELEKGTEFKITIQL